MHKFKKAADLMEGGDINDIPEEFKEYYKDPITYVSISFDISEG